jgi:RimJ/RimL family protein N-acetyltransferase
MKTNNLGIDKSLEVEKKFSNKAFFRLIKESAGSLGPQLGLRINGFDGYFLRPIPTKYDFINDKDVTNLTKWRNLYKNSFLTEFIATDEQTFEWLYKKVHFDDSKILFMLENKNLESIAYLGIGYINWKISYVEADSIVSAGISPKGLMTEALKTLLYWANGQLRLTEVGVRVLSDNPALAFYKKMGFVETKRVPLVRKELGNVITWVEDFQLNTADRFLVHHMWTKNIQ